MKNNIVDIEQNIRFKNNKSNDPTFAITVVVATSIQRYDCCGNYDGGNTWLSTHDFTKDELLKLVSNSTDSDDIIKSFNKGQYRKVVKELTEFGIKSDFAEYFDDVTKYINKNGSHYEQLTKYDATPYIIAFLYGKLDKIQNDDWFLTSNQSWFNECIYDHCPNMMRDYNTGNTVDVDKNYEECC